MDVWKGPVIYSTIFRLYSGPYARSGRSTVMAGTFGPIAPPHTSHTTRRRVDASRRAGRCTRRYLYLPLKGAIATYSTPSPTPRTAPGHVRACGEERRPTVWAIVCQQVEHLLLITTGMIKPES